MKKRSAGTDHSDTQQDDVLYTTVTPSRSTPVQPAASADSGAAEVLYSTVRNQSDEMTSTDQQGVLQYASVTFHHHTAATGPWRRYRSETTQSESAQCCRVSAGVREERGEAVSYSNSECLMGSRLCNQIFPASCVSGASGTEWSVTYNQQEICALEGSTVFMSGSYTHPEGFTVTKTFWAMHQVRGKEAIDLRKIPGYSGRVEYFTDGQKHFSLRLRDVMKKDEHLFKLNIIMNKVTRYFFSLFSKVEEERWLLIRPGVQLRVTDLSVEAPGEVAEGGTAVLTCRTTCSLTDPTFIWYKNGRPLTTNTIKNNQLHLQTVSSEDSGSYSCAVRGYQHLRSTDQSLRVQYAPKSVSVSISPSGKIVEGSSVTLTCSSDANPPVKIYTWFKGSTPVGKGDTYNIPNIRCEHSGEYTCQSRNEHGERRSTAVKINVQYPPNSVSVSISPSGNVVEDSSVTLTCSSDGNPPVKIYTWFKGSTSVGNGDTYYIPNIRSEHSGKYTCQSRNVHGERRSTAVRINVQYPPKSASVSISPPAEIVEGSSVTLTCSSDSNPPVKIYTWFKGSISVGKGDTYNIPNIRSEHSGEYTCQSRNEHGERRSTAVQINVQYPPKKVSVSISGHTVEGSSVNLTCSSDANPPVKIYTWFREGGASPVGSGHSCTITNITAEHTGLYYCVAQNEHGAQNGTVTVTVKTQSLYAVWIAAGGGSSLLLLLTVFICICRWQRQNRNLEECEYENAHPNVKDDTYTALQPTARSSDDVYHTLGAVQSGSSDDTYTALDPQSLSSPEYETLAVSSSHVCCSVRFLSESAQCCRVSAGVREERGGAVSYSNSECLMGSRLCNQIFPASCVSGASRIGWNVKYNQQEICALEGSTVFINGTYIYPEHFSVRETVLVIKPDKDVYPIDLRQDSSYSGRVETFTDEQKHLSLRLSDVMKKDEHQYVFGILTDVLGHGWVGEPGVQLRVTDLRVEAPGEVTEGGTAVLRCRTTCSLTDPTFIWYKNGRPLTTKTIKNNQLHLQPVSSEDAGSYSCAVGGYQHLHSTDQTLRVRYPPKNVSLSISPSGEVLEGSSVNLTCSSDGNPPVKIYTWFKEGGASPVGSGHCYSIINITAEHTGLYYCVAQNEHGAQNGTVMVTVKTQSLSAVWIAVGGGSSLLLLLTVFICICRWKRQKRNLKECDYENADPNAKEDTYTALQPTARSSDDVYHTLGAVQSGSPDDTYTALDPQSLSSPEYETLAVSSSHRLSQKQSSFNRALQRNQDVASTWSAHLTTESWTGQASIDRQTPGHVIRGRTTQRNGKLHADPLHREDGRPSKGPASRANPNAWVNGGPPPRPDQPARHGFKVTQPMFTSVIQSSMPCLLMLVSAGVREERGGAVSYSNSEYLMGSRHCNQIFPASCVSGASGTEWSVKYNQQDICAVEGSTVFMNGFYTHPEHLTVNQTFWVIDPDKNPNWPDVTKDPGYSGRVETLTDKQKHFSLRLSDVMKKDEHRFCFRIITNVEKQRWVGKPGVQLRVTDLQVEASGEVTEGETAVLTCRTTCSLIDPTFIWYKNGRPLTTKTIKKNQLHLQTVSSEDAPSGEVVENRSVTLTCSSDANPPVKIYTWFKGSTSVGNRDTYNIPNIRSEDSGEYTCQSRNEHGERRSAAVQINVQ
ncbi:hypothetical protein NFI96_023553 [Prochilodus magdalenae]|nr:hypothetical protein NFI96_023553 [Prochilodus magdalenae]